MNREKYMLAGLVVLALTACTDSAEQSAQGQVSGPATAAQWFRDVAPEAGLDFVHANGASTRKYLPEIMGSGGSVLDYDGDGWMDLYLVQSGRLPGSEVLAPLQGNRLYRNLGNWRFEDVTDAAGLGDQGYGMGSVAADYDNDGDTDIYVTNFGPDVLYRNNGDGSFSDVTSGSRIDNPAWASSAVFFDADNDGYLDVYVANYLDFTVATHVDCGTPSEGIWAYCHPDVYPMAADVFFRGDGRGGFSDATQHAGLLDDSGHGKGLGVLAADLDLDGDGDLYVANDSTPNYLFRNDGSGRFEEVGLFTGTSHNGDGLTEAGMGVDAGDADGDGWPDLVVTNLSNEPNALYLGGPDFYRYATRNLGLFADSLMNVGFGIDFLDVDADADLDLFVTNGHVIDNIELTDDAQTFRQPSQLFLNEAGRFRLVPAAAAGDISLPGVGRGTMTADLDNDGRLDILVSNNNGPVSLYRNMGVVSGHWIGFDLKGTHGNRDAIGARVIVETTDGKRQAAEKRAGSSYQSSNDPRLHFGLGEAEGPVRVTVHWPGGARSDWEQLKPGRYYRIEEGGEPKALSP